jgi:hypothetical protein
MQRITQNARSQLLAADREPVPGDLVSGVGLPELCEAAGPSFAVLVGPTGQVEELRPWEEPCDLRPTGLCDDRQLSTEVRP